MRRNRYCYAFVLLVFLLLAYMYPHPMTYFALYAILLVALFSFFLGVLSLWGLIISPTLSAQVVEKGEEIQFGLMVKNRFWIPVALVLTTFTMDYRGIFTEEYELYGNVPPKRRVEIAHLIEAPYWGAYELMVQEVKIYDFLGLFAFRWKKALPKLGFVAQPQIFPVNDRVLQLIVKEGEEVKKRRNSVNFSEESELKLYEPMEDSRNIHWKASAKRNELMSKYFVDDMVPAVCFLMDNQMELSMETLGKTDELMESLLSFAFSLHQTSYEISLATTLGAYMDFGGDFSGFYDEMLYLPFGGGNFVKEIDGKIKSGTQVLCFLYALDESVTQALQKLALAGHDVLLICFGLQEQEEAIEKLRQARVVCVDAQEVLV